MKSSFLVALLLGAGLLAAVLWSETASSPALELAFFDVGQGDAVFFETPHGHQVLIDGGPDTKVLSRLGEVMPFWDKTLDLVVLTHPDADHITGLVAVFERYEVENVLWTGRRKDTRVFAAFEAVLKKEGANVFLAQAGQQVVLGESGAVLEILYPQESSDVQQGKSNETSIVARLAYGDRKVLLPGDTTKKIEELLLEAEKDMKADILKIAHHGSDTSSSREFLEAVASKVAVISVGRDNKFGHPTQDVLVNLAEYGIKIRRTDREGTIFFYLK
ncbi:MAG: hypothetical protein A3D64_01175 [Candidatus Wildermuthbacteria bacterium RIFCSPHIGHO2_02_FULL_49_9]|uniref:Metallo-beta-lactamase domain-containing protein n=2 Tax=Candidatus Wildermuthiibacteriota TaxID=1817923 RepID=A0A1G2QYW8_9BACT|nr:MAG: hypothetical protein A2672_02505 [Candidatus Wildermuthbacteria bacterium RIFCSPHIGHO2_01_FULL_49_22b]OHA70473.1 MAG: hypothetical protein A3D64_01175 [Candidatus Wildermuthbacteria bacterium RIFCSPHIGHO2_02_FULL_49_9]